MYFIFMGTKWTLLDFVQSKRLIRWGHKIDVFGVGSEAQENQIGFSFVRGTAISNKLANCS